MLRAVIDIGTNSVKLLVADLNHGNPSPLLEKSKQTRLGRNLYKELRLQDSAIQETVDALAAFTQLARAMGAESIRVIATSATRDAANQQEFLRRATQSSGLPVEVLSGDQEAEWVFLGVTGDPLVPNLPLLILDVGGGSTEFILGQARHHTYRNSFQLGTVRLLEQFPHQDPPTPDDWSLCRQHVQKILDQQVAPSLSPALHQAKGPVQLVGTGGTGTIMARIQLGLSSFDRSQLDGLTLSFEDVVSLRQRLWQLPLNQRQNVPGLPPKRADVILMGTAIYELIMARFQLTTLRISTRGLRFAALLQP